MKRILLLLLSFLLAVPALPAIAEEAQEPQAGPYEALAYQLLEYLGCDTYFAPAEEPAAYENFIVTLAGVLGLDTAGEAEGGYAPGIDGGHYAAKGVKDFYALGYLSKINSFAAGSPITYQDAMALGVCATGYLPKAELAGGTSAAYLAAAREIGLTDNVSSRFTGRDCAVLLYNIMTADLLLPVSYGAEVKYSTFRGRSILTETHRIYRVEGIVTATPESTLTGTDEKLDESSFQINGTAYQAENASPSLLGRNTLAYYQEPGQGDRRLAAAAPFRNEEVSFSGKALEQRRDTELAVYDEQLDKRVIHTLRPGYDFIYNGRAFPAHGGAYFGDEFASVTLVDNDRDGEYDVVFVEQPQYFIVRSVDDVAKKLYEQNGGAALDMSEPDAVIHAWDAEGEQVYWQKFTAGTVLRVTASADGMLFSMNVLEAVIKGDVTGRDEDGRVTVGGETYRESFYLKENDTYALGTTCVFTVDGDVLVTLMSATAGMSYGYLIKSVRMEGIDETPQVKLLKQDGRVGIITLAEKVSIDGGRKQLSSDNAVLAALSSPQLIKYQLDAGGKLLRIDTAVVVPAGGVPPLDTSSGYDSLTRYEYDTPPKWKGDRQLLFPYANIGATPVFVVPSAPDGSSGQDEKYAVTGYSALNLYYDASYPMELYDIDRGGAAGAVVYKNDTVLSGNFMQSASAVIERITQTENGRQLDIVMNGTYSTVSVPDEAVTPDSMAQGDIIRFTTYPDGSARQIKLDFDASAMTPADSGIFNDTGRSNEVGYHMGNVYSMSESYLYLAKSAGPDEPAAQGWGSLVNFSRPGQAVVVDSRKHSVRTASVTEAATILDGQPDFVVLRHNNHSIGNLLVIYR